MLPSSIFDTYVALGGKDDRLLATMVIEALGHVERVRVFAQVDAFHGDEGWALFF